MMPSRILVVRLAGLGDMILTLSAVSPLKRLYPEAEIHFLTEGPMVSFLPGFPFISGCIPYRRGVNGTVRTVHELLRLRADTAIVFERGAKKALLALAAGIPRRIGFDSGALAPFLSDRMPDLRKDPRVHMRERYHALTRPLGVEKPDISIPYRPGPEAEERIDSFFREQGIGEGDFLVGLNPVTGFPSKYWYNDRWAAVADYMVGEAGARLVITYGPEPDQLRTARDIISRMKERAVLSFPTTLAEFAALLKRFHLFLCLDSGPFHYAVSQDIPTISLWGRGNLDQWGPQAEGQVTISKRVFCSPCELFECDRMICMKEIRVEDVIEQARLWVLRNRG